MSTRGSPFGKGGSAGQLASRQTQFSHFEQRGQVVALGLLVLALVIVGRLFYLQIQQFFHYRTLADENRVAVQPEPPPRGLIYDRHGRLLVENEPAFALELYPERVEDTSGVLDRLEGVLPTAAERRDRIEKRIAETPPYLPVTLLEGLGSEQVAKFAARQHQYPSIRIRARSQRHYLEGPLTAHVLGYLAEPSEADFRQFDPNLYPPGTRIGKMGLELAYEEALHGSPGKRKVETDAYGRVVREISQQQPEPGRNLILTLDQNLQRTAHQALAQHPEAALVALDPATGGVLAMASRPTFNPNQFIGGLSSRSWGSLRQAPDEPLVNRAIQGLYPPASTIKPILALAGLKKGTIDPETELTCKGWFSVGEDNQTFRCWRRRGHGEMHVDDAVVQSCDVFFYKLAHRMGIKTVHEAFAQFGLGSRTGIDLPGEREGVNPGPEWKRRNRDEIWYPGDTVNTAIGQGFMGTTPVQLAVMSAAIANGGYRVTPHVVRAVQDPISGEMQYKPPEREAIKVARSPGLKVVRDAMRRVVGSIHGTGHRIAGGWVPVAGKTGTAQVVRIDHDEEEPLDQEEKERRLRDHALFVAYAPAQDPRIAVAVVVEHGISGGRTAATVARKVIDSYFRREG